MNVKHGITTLVGRACDQAVRPMDKRIRQWLVCAICALAAVVISGLWITPNAYGDNSGNSSDTETGVTITDNITDTGNLLGSHATEVSDAISATERESGVRVHLLYLSSFNSKQTPQQWASEVLESTNPKPNTVMLAVASNDGNLVVAVSSNSDEWLKRQSTVDKLSEAAQQPLMESTPNWSKSATDMMNQVVQIKKTSTNSSVVRIGVIAMGTIFVVLAVLSIVLAVLHHRREVKKDSSMQDESTQFDDESSQTGAEADAGGTSLGQVHGTPLADPHESVPVDTDLDEDPEAKFRPAADDFSEGIQETPSKADQSVNHEQAN